MIKHQTLIMTKNQELQFRIFMHSNLSENPEVTIIALNQYRYDFKKLTISEFIKIQEWESKNVPINT